MLFKNKRKIDSKVRFHRSDFRKQLENARGYKRHSKTSGQKNSNVFFEKLGLGTRLSKLILIFFLILASYVIYSPNLFTIKSIQITGLVPANNAPIHNLLANYLQSRPFWPQNNLLLLSKSGLNNYLKNSDDVIAVKSISKKFPSSLSVAIESRTNEFVLETPQKNFIISNDGLVTDETISTASTTAEEGTSPIPQATTSTSSLISGLVPITLPDGSDITVHEQLFNQGLIDELNSFLSQVPPLIQSPFNHYELSDLNTPDLTLSAADGLKVYFDTDNSASDSEQKLQTLLANVAPSDLKKLTYIDLRFNDRAFLCFKNAACDNPTDISTSTPASSSSTLPSL